MSNPITDNMETGVIGELIVQLRLLQYGVQAAPPIVDSGNDLIAVKGEVFKSIQVKTTANGNVHYQNLPDHFHILVLVGLVGEGDELHLDSSRIYLIPRDRVGTFTMNPEGLEEFSISKPYVDYLFEQ